MGSDRPLAEVTEALRRECYVSEGEVRIVLREMVDGYESLRQAAAKWKVSPAYLSDILSGRRQPGMKILRVMGMEKCPQPPLYYASVGPETDNGAR